MSLNDPDYLLCLADMVDPGELWRMNPFDQLSLPPEQKRKLDAGVALRRHAEHVRRLGELIGSGRSLVITPLSRSGAAHMTIPAPEEHRKLLTVSGAVLGRQDGGADV